MASKLCHTCNTMGIGITSLNPIAKQHHHGGAEGRNYRRSRVTNDNINFNLGLGQEEVKTEGEAADIILGRDFPTTLELKDVTKDTFIPRSIGVNHIPNIFLSEISEIAEPKEYESQLRKKGEKFCEDKYQKIKKEFAERTVFEGIEKYFESLEKEDVFIFRNQGLSDGMGKKEWEKDAVIVNLTRAYIFVIEAKSYLTKKLYKNSTDSSFEKARRQMKNTAYNFQKIAKNFQQKWNLVRMIYATEIDSNLAFCPSCKPFVVSINGGKFEDQIREILKSNSHLDIKDWSYANDFYKIVKIILPKVLQIAGNMAGIIDTSINDRIVETIRQNVSKASSPENIVFWSKNQYNIIANFKTCRRVLFTPHNTGYSTGKTVLMAYCAKKMGELNEKVLFVCANSEADHGYFEDKPPLQRMRLQKYFNNDKYVKVIAKNFGGSGKQETSLDYFEEELEKEYRDYHIFIDELHVFDEEYLYERLIKWSQIIDKRKHFWVVSYEYRHYDVKSLKKYFHKRPVLTFPLRNTVEIINFCQSRQNAKLNFDAYGHLNNLSNIEIPSNLTTGIEPREIIAKSYRDGFEKAVDALMELCNQQPALFVIDLASGAKGGCDNCYDYKKLGIVDFRMLKLMEEIYAKKKRYQKIIQYLGS